MGIGRRWQFSFDGALDVLVDYRRLELDDIFPYTRSLLASAHSRPNHLHDCVAYGNGPTPLGWLSRRRSIFIGVIGLVRHVYVVCVCAAHACCMDAAHARVGVKTRGWWDAYLHLCGYRLSEPNSY